MQQEQQERLQSEGTLPENLPAFPAAPKVELIREPGGTYTLIAHTLVPSGCYVAKEACQKTPEGSAIAPETLPVILEIEKQSGPCIQAVTAVRHQLSHLEIPPGKTRLVTFVDMEGEVRQHASLDLMELPEEPGMQPVIETTSWHAWANLMPPIVPDEPRIYVEGKATLPNPCYSVGLVPAECGSSDPRTLDLKLKIDRPPPDWLCPQVVVERTLTYHDSYDPRVEKVNIHIEGGQTVTVKVREVF